MDITNDLLSKILSGDSSCKVNILNWHIENNIIKNGNSHSSGLSRLIVEYQRKGKTFKKSFILKIPSAHPVYEIGVRYDVYIREYPIYTSVLEEMYKIDGEHIGPRLYYAGAKHSLMLKDLSMSGYKMANRIEQLDYQQCNLVFQSLAKFHALSVKLNQQPALKMSSKYNDASWLKRSQCVDEMRKCMQTISDNFEKAFDFKSKKLTEIFVKFKNWDSMEGIFRGFAMSDNINFQVLNHGDCWTGNVLFKSDKYGNVKKVKFIDFQRCLWTSPAHDILYFTVTSMRFEVFQKYFDLLLENYIETLNNVLRHFDCPESYTLQDVRRDIDNLSIYSILTLVLFLPPLFSDQENSSKDSIEKINYTRYHKPFQDESYKNLVTKWISYYKQTGFLD